MDLPSILNPSLPTLISTMCSVPLHSTWQAIVSDSPSNNGSSAPASTAGSSATTGSASSSTSVSDNNGSNSNRDELKVNRVITAYGTIMGISFVIIFPLGALLIRLCSFRGLVRVHAGLQIFGYTIAMGVLGLRVYIALVPSSQVRNYSKFIVF